MGSIQALSSLGYKHFVVEHKNTFKQICTDAVTGESVTVHINTIKGSWKHAKAHFRRIKGTKIDQFEGHLCETMWRWWHKGSKVTGILNLIQKFYPLDSKPVMTASHPVFRTWFQHQQASANDSLSRVDSSDYEQDTDVEISPQVDEHSSQQEAPSVEVSQEHQEHSSQHKEATTNEESVQSATSHITATNALLVRR